MVSLILQMLPKLDVLPLFLFFVGHAYQNKLDIEASALEITIVLPPVDIRIIEILFCEAMHTNLAALCVVHLPKVHHFLESIVVVALCVNINLVVCCFSNSFLMLFSNCKIVTKSRNIISCITINSLDSSSTLRMMRQHAQSKACCTGQVCGSFSSKESLKRGCSHLRNSASAGCCGTGSHLI